MRRALIILGILIVLAGLGVAVYFMFFADSVGVTVTPAGNSELPVAGQITPGSATGGSTSGGASTGAPGASGGTPVAISARLMQISAGPIVPGEAVITLKAPKVASTTATSTPETSVAYIERESGNVFSYLVNTKTLTRINNRTVPGIQSALWLPDASMAFVQYLSGADFSTINTYALPATSVATSSGGFFLSQNISSVAVSTAGLLTLASGVNGSVASLSRADGTHPTTLFTTPLTAIRVSFAGKNQYLVFSKPSGTLSGYAFIVDSAGRFTRIAGPRRGLSAIASQSGKWVLVSYTDANTLRTELVNTLLGTTLPLPLGTIADKCVWSPDETAVYCGVPIETSDAFLYPDDWYQGAVHFSDRLWRIDVAGRYAQMILDFSLANKGDLDAWSLAVDSANTTLVFINKNDSSLWSYSL